jgi:intracellular multiplication protein IcmP
MSNAQNRGPDPLVTLVLVFVVLALGAAIFWHVFRVQILEGLRWLRLGELWLVGLFSHQQDRCFQWLQHASTRAGEAPSPLMIGMTYDCFGSSFMASLPTAEKANYYALTGISMGAIEEKATSLIRWPLAAAFAAVAVYVTYVSPRGKFRTKHSLESFIKTQAKMWPVIAPIVDFNPIKSSARIPGSMVPDKLPLFAEALSPEEWISWHRIQLTNGVVDREAARRALLLQLGPRWNGIQDLPLYFQALFAAFALKGAQKREESDEFLGKISLCWSAKNGFHLTPSLAAEVHKILADPALGGKAVEQAALYAYRTTAMVGVLRWARTMGGVLAPGQFVWLRGTDRNLWYALNNLGRRSFHSEGMGAMAHFMAEQAAKKPLPIPRVDTAIVTLNQFLSDPEKRSIPIPPREGDNAKSGR